jgi:hypothetical protein
MDKHSSLLTKMESFQTWPLEQEEPEEQLQAGVHEAPDDGAVVGGTGRHHQSKLDPFDRINIFFVFTEMSQLYERTLVPWFKSNLLLIIQIYNMSLLHESY